MNVKERVLLIAETKGISKTEFFKDVQLSYANFKGGQKNTALSSDAMVAILSKHPDISPAWLLMGEGTMMRKDERNVVSALEQTVKAQEKTIQSLEGQVSLLQRK